MQRQTLAWRPDDAAVGRGRHFLEAARKASVARRDMLTCRRWSTPSALVIVSCALALLWQYGCCRCEVAEPYHLKAAFGGVPPAWTVKGLARILRVHSHPLCSDESATVAVGEQLGPSSIQTCWNRTRTVTDAVRTEVTAWQSPGLALHAPYAFERGDRRKRFSTTVAIRRGTWSRVIPFSAIPPEIRQTRWRA
jgi:hypothetical protein